MTAQRIREDEYYLKLSFYNQNIEDCYSLPHISQIIFNGEIIFFLFEPLRRWGKSKTIKELERLIEKKIHICC